MKRLRLFLVDDHAVVRVGLRALLEGEPDMEVVGEAGTAAEAIAAVPHVRPDIVLMDIRLPDLSGIEACRRIRKMTPETQVVMLTSYADDDLVLEAIEAGAVGYVLKHLSTDALLDAIRAVGQGEGILDPAVTRRLLSRIRKAIQTEHSAAFRELSEREMQILALMARGKSNSEIARILGLQEKTVRNHVSTIFSKIGVTNRVEAATYAVRHHIEEYVQLPEDA